eukprot:6796248-Pyramimonas_sp.AAC.1
MQGRQVFRGRPYLHGDGRIHSGLRMESEVLVTVGHKKLLRDSDAIMTSGINGGISPSRTVQLIGIKPNNVQCEDDRVGQ